MSRKRPYLAFTYDRCPKHDLVEVLPTCEQHGCSESEFSRELRFQRDVIFILNTGLDAMSPKMSLES